MQCESRRTSSRGELSRGKPGSCGCCTGALDLRRVPTGMTTGYRAGYGNDWIFCVEIIEHGRLRFVCCTNF